MNKTKYYNEYLFGLIIFSLIVQTIFAYALNHIKIFYLSLIIPQATLLLCILSIFFIFKELKISEYIKFKYINFFDIIMIILLSIFIIPIVNIISLISQLAFKNEINDIVTNLITTYPFPVTFFLIAIVPAIVEEICFRGVTFSILKKTNTLQAILISALTFGLVHLNFNQFLYAFVIGLIFAILVLITDSLIYPMIIHCFINGTSITLQYTLLKHSSETGSMGANDIKSLITPTLILVFFISLIIECALIYFLSVKYNSTNKLKNLFKKENNKNNISSFTLIAFILICLSVMIRIQYFKN